MKKINDLDKAIKDLDKRDISEIELVYTEDFLNKLNHEQRVAATRKEGNYLVIAGPGSGKTHTLSYRVVYLVKNKVDPQSIVVITFTRKAGRELKERINYLLPNTSLGFIGTFHAFSHFISTKLGNSSPISGFRLLDPEDDVQVHKLVMADFKPFNKKINAKRIQKIISYCYNTGLSIGEYITTFDIHDLRSDIQNLGEYIEKYEHYKASHLLTNYDDMIRLVTKYLKGDSGTKITSSFEYLMIDEYQDTNQMQLDFIKRLKIENTMAIGDDFQGIYAFRGADHRIILNFINDFENAKMIKLKDNYRSTKEIVDYVNKTVERSNLGYHKKFRVVKDTKGHVEVVAGRSLDEHKDFILGNIKSKSDETHALIYRYNKNRIVYEKALIEENIDYSVYGGIRLLERKHIKDVLAFLMVYLNRLDVVGFNRLLTLLPGVGAKTSKKLMESNLEDLTYLAANKREHLSKVKEILDSFDTKEVLFKNICEFYFSIYESVESGTYSKDEIKEDFRLINELLESYGSLNNFVINLILDPVVDMHKGKRPKVILTTIHSAKGLEFDNVYYFHTHDWYKNYDVESLEEDRRLLYVGISRAKKNLYVFDHTGYNRSFDEILRDFDNQNTIIKQSDETIFESKADMISTGENKLQEEKKESFDELDYENGKYEIIDGEAFELKPPGAEHQNTLSVLAGEFYMYFRDRKCKSFLGPQKIKLNRQGKDINPSYVQPDLFVVSDKDNVKDGIYLGIPDLIIEVVSAETRSKDMIKKMDLYMSCGVKEYWIVDTDSKLTMVHSFDKYDLAGTQVFLMNQDVRSKVFDEIKINMNDLI